MTLLLVSVVGMNHGSRVEDRLQRSCRKGKEWLDAGFKDQIAKYFSLPYAQLPHRSFAALASFFSFLVFLSVIIPYVLMQACPT